jgi:hypothetical protein
MKIHEYIAITVERWQDTFLSLMYSKHQMSVTEEECFWMIYEVYSM